MTAAWLKWLPAGIVPAVIAGVALTVPLQAAATTDLPDKTPEQVLTMIADSSVHAFSGTIEQTANLGLPELPDIGGLSDNTGPGSAGTEGAGFGSAISSALELLTGTHTARVYIDGPDNARVQVMGSMAERDVIRQGDDVWFYDSADNSAVHLTLPERPAGVDTGADAGDAQHDDAYIPGTEGHTPADMAHRLLATMEPSTTATIGDDTKIAGRSAYDLQLTPRASDTLIGQISIAVDSETGLPLSVEIQANGQDEPAFELAFTELSLQTPDASLFTFTPPKDATVKEHTLTMPELPGGASTMPALPGGTPDGNVPAMKHTMIGTGWDTIVELPAGAVPSQILASPLLSQMLQSVDGGEMLSTALVNVLFTNDGRVLAGSVTSNRLQDAAAGR